MGYISVNNNRKCEMAIFEGIHEHCVLAKWASCAYTNRSFAVAYAIRYNKGRGQYNLHNANVSSRKDY